MRYLQANAVGRMRLRLSLKLISNQKIPKKLGRGKGGYYNTP